MASTAMPDILATAVALVAMERLAAWKSERKWGQGATAAVALGLAGFARPHLSLLLPLAAFFLLESTNPKEILRQIRRVSRLFVPVFAGAVLLWAIIAITREYNLAINPPTAYSGRRNIYIRCSFISFISCFLCPWPPAGRRTVTNGATELCYHRVTVQSHTFSLRHLRPLGLS